MNIQIDHINMSVEDLNKTISWYETIFDFKIVETGKSNNTNYAIIRNQNSMLCLYEIPQKKHPMENRSHKIYHFGFRIESTDDWLQKIKDFSISINSQWDYPHSKSWYINDPTGHEIEVSYWHNNSIEF